MPGLRQPRSWLGILMAGELRVRGSFRQTRLTGRGNRESDACHNSLGLDFLCHLLDVGSIFQVEQGERLVARVEAKHNLLERSFGPEMLVKPTIDVPPQDPAVAFAIEVGLNGTAIFFRPVGSKNGQVCDFIGTHQITPLMGMVERYM